METKELTCIGCPMGCRLTVEFEPGNRESVKVSGNTCKRGELYAADEVISPTRTVTGTVRIANRKGVVAPVKTSAPIPRDRIADVAKEMMKISLDAPVRIGETACENVCGTGRDLVVTGNID